jgi:nucleoside triphosphatase
MADDRGVFPDQWNRVKTVKPPCGGKFVKNWATRWKSSISPRGHFGTKRADGAREKRYTLSLIFDCISANRDVTFNVAFQKFAWVRPSASGRYDLNAATRQAFQDKGLPG